MSKLDNIIKYNDECVSKFISLINNEMKNGIQSIYNETRKNNKEKKKILKEFQKDLSNIPKWSENVLENEYNRIKMLSKCDYFDDLIKNIFKSYFKVLFLIKKKREKLSVPSSTKVIHYCYISLAREIWKKPILFYHKFKKKDIQNNHNEINKLISISIKSAIKDLLPFNEILSNYLHEDTIESDDEYDDFEDHYLGNNNNLNETEDFIEDYKFKDNDNTIINNNDTDNDTDNVTDNVKINKVENVGGDEDEEVENVEGDDVEDDEDDAVEGDDEEDDAVEGDDEEDDAVEGDDEEVENVGGDEDKEVENVGGDDVEGDENVGDVGNVADVGGDDDVEGDENVGGDDVEEVENVGDVGNVADVGGDDVEEVENVGDNNFEKNIQPNVNIKIDNKKKKKKNKMNSANKIEKLLGKKITKEDIKNNKKLKRKLLKEYNSK